ncbi:hypothetical protein ACFL5Q_07830, partial [Planctomycetota bacterium]
LNTDGWILWRLSARGRWVIFNSGRLIRVFDMDADPPREFTTPQGIRSTVGSNPGIGTCERWIIDYRGLSTSVATRHIYDLNDRGQGPCFSLDSSNTILKTSSSGDWLVGVHSRDGQDILRAWNLPSAKQGNDAYRDLAHLPTRKPGRQRFWLGEETDSLVALTRDGLLAWDLSQIEKQPETLSTGSPVVEVRGVPQTRQVWWLISNIGSVWWREATDRCFLVPLDAPLGQRPRLVTSSHPVLYDGQFLVEQLTNSYWLTDFTQHPPVKQPLIARQEHGIIGPLLLASESRWVLATIVRQFDLPTKLTPEARLVSLDRQRASIVPFPLCGTYWLSGNQRWLVGLSGDYVKYWNLRSDPTPAGDGDIKGFSGQVRESCLADRRWLILLNERRQAYFVDLESDAELCAVPFFRLGDGKHSPHDEVSAAGKHVLLAMKQPATASVWHVSSFENWKRAD